MRQVVERARTLFLSANHTVEYSCPMGGDANLWQLIAAHYVSAMTVFYSENLTFNFVHHLKAIFLFTPLSL